MANGFGIFDLTGRTALVTGGATGIGKCIAKGLAGVGASVVIASRKETNLKEAVQEIIAETGNERVAYVQADLAKREDAEGLVTRAVGKFGRLDILLGDAAQEMWEPIESFTDSSIDQMLAVNLVANIILLRSAIPHLKKHGCGRVIFISSILAETGSTIGSSVYGATKAGLHAIARNTAFELGPDGITVNCVAPGFTLTSMMQTYLDALGAVGARELEALVKTTALNRPGRPQDMVGPVLMLASDAGSFITGQFITVDGGTSIRMR